MAAADHQRRVLRVGAAGIDAPSFLDSDCSLISSSATFKSDMCCQRRAGSFRRQRLTRCSTSGGTETRISQTGFGSRCRIAESVDSFESPSKARSSCEHLVQKAAETEDVRACVHRLAFRLLRRHVGDRADNPTFLAIRMLAFRRDQTPSRRFRQLRQPEIQ